MAGAWTDRVAAWGDPRRPWGTADRACAAALALLLVVLRWPQRARTLTMWDSIWFALGVERYDVAASQPHPPGYPVFVAAARVVRLAVPEVETALVVLSLGLAALSVALLYRLVREWGSRRAAVAASLLYLLSPVLGFNAIVALSYTGEAAASIGVALLSWRTRQRPTKGRVVALMLAWALAAGLRQSLLLFLTPVVAWSLMGPGEATGRRMRWGWAASTGTAGILAWFVPMIVATPGGYGSWSLANGSQTRNVVFADTVATGGFAALADHARRLALFLDAERVLVPALGLLVLAGLVAGVYRRRGFAEALAFPAGAPAFLAWWLLPALAFYLLVFDGLGAGPTGYVLTILPAVYALYAWLGDAALRAIEWHPRSAVRRAAAVLALPLLVLPAPLIADDLAPLAKREVSDHDGWAEAWSHLDQAFPPNETAILTWYNWAHGKWYFPEYTAWTYLPIAGDPGEDDWVLTLETRDRRDDRPVYRARAEGPGPTHTIPPGMRHVVVFDFQLAGENGGVRRLREDVEVREARLPNDWRVLYFAVEPGRAIEDYFLPLPDAAHLTDDFRL